MLKWACILLVIVDLILVGGAAFRFLTAPKAEVQKYVETYEKNAARIQAEAKGVSSESGDSEGEVIEGFSAEDFEEMKSKVGESTAVPKKTIQEQAAENKPIEMTEDTVFEMDDQGMKQEKLNESKRAMRAVFGTEKRNTVEE